MINIFLSTSIRETSTTEDTLNDLATRWSWKDITYDLVTPSNVTRLWISDNIYIATADSMTRQFRIVHGGVNKTVDFASRIDKYTLVTTENELLLYNTTDNAQFFCISKTKNLDEETSEGIIFNTSTSENTIYCFTDNMTLDNVSYSNQSFLKTSLVNTVLIPIYSITGDEQFEDIYFPFLTKTTDYGKVVMNNDYYYLHSEVAIKYTP